MERHVWSTCQQSLAAENSPSLQSLSTIRSLIINPNTSDSTISSILETLTRSLRLSAADSRFVRHHLLKLLSDLAERCAHLSPQIFDSVRSDSLVHLSAAKSNRPASESLSVLASISERDRGLKYEIDDGLFVSLCFGPSISARLWLLRNAERLGVGANVMFTVFLGFTKDPYPYVRRAALDGLGNLGKCGVFEDCNVIEGCYYRAVELLQDNEDCVRAAAVRVVSEWGRMLVAVNQENEKGDWSDAVFLQLCAIVRDMSVEVRVEAFSALGKMHLVSEGVLLQTLSKKVLGNVKQKKSQGQSAAKRFEIVASSAAGAFVHGLEDEFYEVRRSACDSLRMLTTLSAAFAGQAVSLLMDILNDDSMVVRLEALETLNYMATCEYLKVQEIHMHMFLGMLNDNNDIIRSTARRIFKFVKLPNFELFRLSVGSLIDNLEVYPQDEADVFSALFFIGQSHQKFGARMIREVLPEIEPVSEGELSLDSARVAAFLVLSISGRLSQEQNDLCIPPRLFSYAATLLGRISFALNDVDQKTLLAYLSQCSRYSSYSGTEIKGKLPDVQSQISTDGNYTAVMPLMRKCTEVQSVMPCDIWKREHQPEDHDEVTKYVNHILAKVKDVWPLVQLRCINEVSRILRAWKEELTILSASLESAGALAFTSHYLQVMKLLTKLWDCGGRKIESYEMEELEILLGKLDRKLRDMRCRFLGFSKQVELHVLELMLVACILRLSKPEICCYLTTLKRLSTTVAHVELLLEGGSVEPSNFVVEVKKALHEIGTSTGGIACNFLLFTELLSLFRPKQFILGGRVNHVNAELDVPDNDSENPIPFFCGLPVAIPLKITLHNVSGENRLWLRMAMNEESTQFVFLDQNLFGGYDGVKKFTFMAPFYRTPKACSFTLKVCIGMEYMFEDAHLNKGFGGPKRALIHLGQEKEVYLYRVGY